MVRRSLGCCGVSREEILNPGSEFLSANLPSQDVGTVKTNMEGQALSLSNWEEWLTFVQALERKVASKKDKH